METSNLILDFRINRDLFETLRGARSALPCANHDSMIVFPHDLKAFAIPAEHVSCLAETYQRYLVASGILNCSSLAPEQQDSELGTHQPDYDEEQLSYDQTTLCLIHGALKVPFKKSAFNLDAAINFVEQETNLSRTLAIRWCMMMEYVSYEDQRTDELRKRKTEGEAYNASAAELGEV